jgi:hypothetical protein
LIDPLFLLLLIPPHHLSFIHPFPLFLHQVDIHHLFPHVRVRVSPSSLPSKDTAGGGSSLVDLLEVEAAIESKESHQSSAETIEFETICRAKKQTFLPHPPELPAASLVRGIPPTLGHAAGQTTACPHARPCRGTGWKGWACIVKFDWTIIVVGNRDEGWTLYAIAGKDSWMACSPPGPGWCWCRCWGQICLVFASTFLSALR